MAFSSISVLVLSCQDQVVELKGSPDQLHISTVPSVAFNSCATQIPVASLQQAEPVAHWPFNSCDVDPDMFPGVGAAPAASAQRILCALGPDGSAAPQFDGSAKLEIANNVSLNPSEALTLSVRVRAATADSKQSLVSKWDAPHAYGLWLEDSSWVFRVAVKNTGCGGGIYEVRAPATFGQWTHLAGVYDGANLVLYVNGQRRAERAGLQRGLQSSERPIIVGNHPPGAGFRGTIADLRIYDVPLGASQVSALSRRPSPVAYTTIFATSQEYLPEELGGLDGADQKCSELATLAKRPGVWRALLSDSDEDARDHVTIVGALYTTEGSMLARNATALWSGTILTKLKFNEWAEEVAPFWIFTGTRVDGTKNDYRENRFCQNWTVTEGTRVGAGSSGHSDQHWIDYYEGGLSFMSCLARLRIFCVGQEDVS